MGIHRLRHPVILALSFSFCLIAWGEDRTVSFPGDKSYGVLLIRPDGFDGYWHEAWKHIGLANGAVQVPEGMDLRLDVSGAAAKDLSWIDPLGPNDIQYVSLAGTEVTNEALVHLTHLQNLEWLNLLRADISSAGIEALYPLTKLEAIFIGADAVDDGVVKALQPIQSLKEIWLNTCPITDRAIEYLSDLPNLQDLVLMNVAVTDEGFRHIGRMANLQRLECWEVKVGDEGMAHLAGLTKLENAELYGANISDEGAKHLAKIKSLKTVRLDGTKIGDAALASFGDLPQLEKLFMPQGITDAGLAHISQYPKLSFLSVGTQRGVSDEGVAHLAKMETLEHLDIGGKGVTDESLKHLAEAPNIRGLWLQNCSITDDGLQHLGRMHSLETLLLSARGITSKGLMHLAELHNLTDLNLAGIEIGEDGLDFMANMNKVEHLTLRVEGVADDDLRHLAGMPNLSFLNLTTKSLSDAAFESLAKLQKLNNVTIWGPFIGDETLGYLAHSPELDYLQINGEFTDAGLKALEQSPVLRSLRIMDTGFSEEAKASLETNLPSLQSVTYVEPRNYAAKPAPGETPPPLNAKSLADGTKVALADYKGRVVVLYFWATWCGPCVRSTPSVKKLYDDLRKAHGDDVAMLSLSLDTDEYKPKRHAEENGLVWPQLILEKNEETARAWGIRGVPTYFVVDRGGTVISNDVRNHQQIRELVAEALSNG